MPVLDQAPNEEGREDGYVTLTTAPKEGNESIVEVSLDDLIKIEEDASAEKVEEAEVIVVEENQEEVVKPTKSVKPRSTKPNRAQKRIKNLLQENTEREDENLKLRQQIAEMEVSSRETSQSANQSLVDTLDSQIASLQSQYSQALQDSDSDKIVAVQDALWNAKLQKDRIENNIQVIENTPEPEVQVKKPKSKGVSEKALEWVDTYPEFKTDAIFYSASMAVNNQLINEGYDPDSKIFYTELNKRLAPRFSDVFDKSGEDAVEYVEDQQDDDLSSTEETETPSRKQSKDSSNKSLRTPPVSGASRAAVLGSSSVKSSKNKVQLNAHDQAAAENFGMTLKEYAKRKKHIDDSTSEGGYSPIIL